MSDDDEVVRSEVEVLKSIYGDGAVKYWESESSTSIRYEVTLSLSDPHEEIAFKVLVSLSPSYPAKSPPQLQLLSRWIGAFAPDSALFNSVLKTYISVSGVEWIPETVCVFDGLQNILEHVTAWYEERLNTEAAGALLREESKTEKPSGSVPMSEPESAVSSPQQSQSVKVDPLPEGVRIFEAEPIVDRKSSFVGRACVITDPAQVPLILAHISSDRRVARAAHPIINAWRCQIGSVLHQDNDDNGETAAGGRLAHLLQILELQNVLVIVTRYFGGIHLGPDRFKHINQAARNALEIGGFLDADIKKTGRKKH